MGVYYIMHYYIRFATKPSTEGTCKSDRVHVKQKQEFFTPKKSKFHLTCIFGTNHAYSQGQTMNYIKSQSNFIFKTHVIQVSV